MIWFSRVLMPIFITMAKPCPALSEFVILTIVTYIVGFVVFLGLGSLLLL